MTATFNWLVGKEKVQKINFVKMQGAGNDFIVIDARQRERDWEKLAKAMCHRCYGVGADGLLLVLPSQQADLKMRMFNPDGSEAEACGNGLRCFAKYVVEKGLASSSWLTIETMAGIRKVETQVKNKRVVSIRVSMGLPQFRPQEIPVAIEGERNDYSLAVEGRNLALNFVSMGNPHAVCFLSEPVESFPLTAIGPIIEHHPLFPQRTNFGIANILSPRQLKARVWERGAGETLACGTGACALAVVGRRQRVLSQCVDIILPGGVLTVEWDGAGEVWLSGPAERVFTGKWIDREQV